MFKIIRDRIESGEPVNFQEAIELMSLEGHECIELFSLANRVRSMLGDRVDLCSIINAKCGMCLRTASSAPSQFTMIPV